jgi:hypothetical protein
MLSKLTLVHRSKASIQAKTKKPAVAYKPAIIDCNRLIATPHTEMVFNKSTIRQVARWASSCMKRWEHPGLLKNTLTCRRTARIRAEAVITKLASTQCRSTTVENRVPSVFAQVTVFKSEATIIDEHSGNVTNNPTTPKGDRRTTQIDTGTKLPNIFTVGAAHCNIIQRRSAFKVRSNYHDFTVLARIPIS